MTGLSVIGWSATTWQRDETLTVVRAGRCQVLDGALLSVLVGRPDLSAERSNYVQSGSVCGRRPLSLAAFCFAVRSWSVADHPSRRILSPNHSNRRNRISSICIETMTRISFLSPGCAWFCNCTKETSSHSSVYFVPSFNKCEAVPGDVLTLQLLFGEIKNKTNK